MSETKEPTAPKTEQIEDLEPKQDPKGGIIAILIGLNQPATPPVELLPAVQLPAVQNPGDTTKIR